MAKSPPPLRDLRATHSAPHPWPKKPTLEPVPLATGLRWRGGNSSGYLFQEKSDGRHEFATIAGATVNAERMAGGELVINDLVSLPGQDMRQETTRTRWAELNTLFASFSVFSGQIRLTRVGQGGEFLEHLLREGGEGIVAKPLDAPFGANWHKCKRAETHFCRVAALDPIHGSVELADAASDQPRGKLPLRGKFDSVRIGTLLKVEAYGLTARGILREARLDKDTPTSWLVKW